MRFELDYIENGLSSSPMSPGITKFNVEIYPSFRNMRLQLKKLCGVFLTLILYRNNFRGVISRQEGGKMSRG